MSSNQIKKYVYQNNNVFSCIINNVVTSLDYMHHQIKIKC